MKVLAFDSTAKSASVAVCDGGRLLAEYTVDNGLTQSELLLPMAEDLLRSLKLSFSDIELLAASVGPGSFTGVRIGVSLVKGLAFGRNIPCASVSTLEALAENLSGISGIIVPVMDARRGEVYTAIFSSSEAGVTRLTEDMAISIVKLGEMLREYEGTPIYLVGDGYATAKAGLSSLGIITERTPELVLRENAYSVAVCAIKKHEEDKCITDKEMSPTYLRVPQAERERLERLGGNK